VHTRSLSVGSILAASIVLAMGVIVAGCERDRTTADPPAQPVADQETQIRAQTLIDQVILHIRNGQFDAAETSLHELEKISATLPEGMQRQVDTARASLTAARTAAPQQPVAQPQAGQ
jgi:hypothetical protein